MPSAAFCDSSVEKGGAPEVHTVCRGGEAASEDV